MYIDNYNHVYALSASRDHVTYVGACRGDLVKNVAAAAHPLLDQDLWHTFNAHRFISTCIIIHEHMIQSYMSTIIQSYMDT